MEFNPMQETPTNDKQAEIALRHERPATLGDSLYGLYQCSRALGLPVLEAYIATLQAYLDSCEKARQEREVNAK